LEMGQAQGKEVTELIEKMGDFLAPQRYQDLSGIDRVVKAQRKVRNSKPENYCCSKLKVQGSKEKQLL